VREGGKVYVEYWCEATRKQIIRKIKKQMGG
jgi:hypothetical protein